MALTPFTNNGKGVLKMEEKSADFFEKLGLEVAPSEVEIGQTYPIYGMITKILDDTPGQVIVELNFSITAHMMIPEIAKVELLKERAFEPGIFVSTIKTKDSGVVVDCSTVVFGKKQRFEA